MYSISRAQTGAGGAGQRVRKPTFYYEKFKKRRLRHK